MARKLSFYDNHRQNYHEATWRPEHRAHIGDFWVGDYVGSGGVGPRGEMSLKLYDFARDRHIVNDDGYVVSAPRELTVKIECFTDALGTLRALERMGVIEKIKRASIYSRDDLARLLIDKGLRDRSDQPMEVTT